MSRGRVAILAGLAVFLVFAAWAGWLTHSARSSARDLISSVQSGNVPQDLDGPARLLAENIVEYGLSDITVGRVRLTFKLKARVNLVLKSGEEEAEAYLLMEREDGRWQGTDASESNLEVQFKQDRPRLVLALGDESLSKDLESLGRDKLLTLQPGRIEWLNQGWQQPQPYFAGFNAGLPGEIIIGTGDVELYSHNNGLAAANVLNPSVPEKIRVNITTTGQESVRHDRLVIASEAGLKVTEAVTGRNIVLPPGAFSLRPDQLGIVLETPQGEEYFSHRLIFLPVSGGEIQLTSITRSGGRKPKYYGSMEVANFDGDLVLVNELPLESYLYSVLPSEMPSSFGVGALEVQAIVARTFALRNLLASGWRSTSAHVVDSVLSQVYNNTAETASAVAAVDATQGEIVSFDGEPVDVKFFSTSSGFTASSHEVWPDGQGSFPGNPIPWLTSRPQFPNAVEFSGEEAYADFIHNPPAQAYDAKSAWFRWQVTIPAAQLEEIIRENLISIHCSSPTSIQRQDGSGFSTVEKMPADPLGELLDLVPSQRGAGGVLISVDLVGSKGTWRVFREYYIRHVLRPVGSDEQPIFLSRHSGSKLKNFSLLPSAYVVWELKQNGGKLQDITFHGGGFGHGVGMSQYGVRELVARGWSRIQIIQHYFPGTQISNMGQ